MSSNERRPSDYIGRHSSPVRKPTLQPLIINNPSPIDLPTTTASLTPNSISNNIKSPRAAHVILEPILSATSSATSSTDSTDSKSSNRALKSPSHNLVRRPSIPLIAGAIQNVADVAAYDMHTHNPSTSSSSEYSFNQYPTSIMSTNCSSTLLNDVSLLRENNARIVQEVDHLVALVSSESSMSFSSCEIESNCSTEVVMNSKHRTSIGSALTDNYMTSPSKPNQQSSVNTMLRELEDRLARDYDRRLQDAINETRLQSETLLAQIEADYNSRIQVERQLAFEKVEMIRKTALIDSNERVANLTRMLVQNISHEMRTPLNVISTGLLLIEGNIQQYTNALSNTTSNSDLTTATMDIVEDRVDMSEILNIANDLKDSCTECNRFLDDVVLYENIKLGQCILHYEDVSIHLLLKNALKEYAQHAKLCRITLVYEFNSILDAEPINVFVDKSKLKLIIDRYLSCAIHFTPADGTVTLRADCTQSLLRVEFIDTGSGIDSESCKYMFSESCNEKHTNSLLKQGGGLRMWVCKAFLELMNGATGVTSLGEGCGTTYYFELPLTREAFSPSSSVSIQSTFNRINADEFIGFADIVKGMFGPPKKVARKSEYKVLVVDDVGTCRKMHVRLFGEYCRSCKEASDGVECVSLVKESMAESDPFDLVLLDNSMPNMSGPEAAKQLREYGFKGKIFGVTGNARDEDISDFLLKGADKVFLKPLGAEAIKVITSELSAMMKSKWVLSKWRK